MRQNLPHFKINNLGWAKLKCRSGPISLAKRTSVNLLAEKEVTKILQLVHVVCTHMDLDKEARDDQVAELGQNTAVETLAQELRRTMPQEK